jgi:hypothetical protein
VKIVPSEKHYPPSIVKVTVHNVIWVYPITFLLVSKQLFDTREGESRNETLLCIMMNEWDMLIA